MPRRPTDGLHQLSEVLPGYLTLSRMQELIPGGAAEHSGERAGIAGSEKRRRLFDHRGIKPDFVGNGLYLCEGKTVGGADAGLAVLELECLPQDQGKLILRVAAFGGRYRGLRRMARGGGDATKLTPLPLRQLPSLITLGQHALGEVEPFVGFGEFVPQNIHLLLQSIHAAW